MGYDFHVLRAEINYSSRSNLNYLKYEHDDFSSTQESQEIKSHALMLDFYKDFHNKTIFIPYVFTGIGINRIKTNDFISVFKHQVLGVDKITSPGSSRNNLSWQVGLGTQIKVTDKVFLDLKYRYVNLGKVHGIDPGYYFLDPNNLVREKFKLRAKEFAMSVRVSI